MSRYNTPLRYPGGKQRLTPFILEVMTANNLEGGHYAEPYAGGAGIAIELLLNGHVSHIHLNDACLGIYAFWRSILTNTEAFCRLISRRPLTIKEWGRQREILSRSAEFNQLEIGFSTFYLNRCNRSGILSGGLIGGRKQTGKWKMDARFPRKELIRRIEAIAVKRNSITLKNWDAETFIRKHLPTLPKASLVYCDPPYFHKGAKRLYLNYYRMEDHVRIAAVIQKINRPWVVSYDAAPEILEYYSERSAFVYKLYYHAAQARKGKEAFFFSEGLKLPTSSTVRCINSVLKKMTE